MLSNLLLTLRTTPNWVYWSALVILVLFILLVMYLTWDRPPRYRPKQILTKNELEFFGRLSKAAPNLYIFPQVAMSALIEPDEKGKRWMSAFGRISQKRIDYGLFNKEMELLAIVELDDRTHNVQKDALRDSYTRSAGIRTLRFESRARPTIGQLRSAIEAL